MIAICGVIVILVIATILDVFCNLRVIEATHQRLERLFTGKGYLRFFGLTAVFALLLYAIGIATMGPFLGLYEAGIQIGTMCLLAFLGGLVMCVFGVGRDVGSLALGSDRKGRRGPSMLGSTVFVTAVWGCVILLTFYDHSISGPLISVSVNL